MDSSQNKLPLVESQQVSLFDSLFILKRHQGKIIIITLMSILMSFFYTFWIKPVYTSKGRILVEDSSSTLDIFDFSSGSSQSYLENEIEILRSRKTAQKAVKKLINLHKLLTISGLLILFLTRK